MRDLLKTDALYLPQKRALSLKPRNMADRELIVNNLVKDFSNGLQAIFGEEELPLQDGDANGFNLVPEECTPGEEAVPPEGAEEAFDKTQQSSWNVQTNLSPDKRVSILLQRDNSGQSPDRLKMQVREEEDEKRQLRAESVDKGEYLNLKAKVTKLESLTLEMRKNFYKELQNVRQIGLRKM